jgi:branched-chain amino acid transport system substrate-binding protein
LRACGRNSQEKIVQAILRRGLVLAIAGLTILSGTADAQNELKIALITTLSGPDAAQGRDVADGFRLGVRLADGRLGGLPTDLILSDDHGRADFGRVLAERALRRDQADIIAGFVSANVLQAAADTVLGNRDEVFFISAGVGPAALAGKKCHPNLFVTAPQEDSSHETMGRHMTSSGVKTAYLLAPNTAAGKEALAAFKRGFRGTIAAEIYTRSGQSDYTAEIGALRASRPDSAYVFYPGAMGVDFLRQYGESTLTTRIPLFGPFQTFDQTVLAAVGKNTAGAHASTSWSERLANPANESFVRDFETVYGRLPGAYAAQGYDAARMIDAALRQAGGMTNRSRFRDALCAADFLSVRGAFKFNRNQFPVETYYLTRVDADDRGKPVNAVRGVIVASHADGYAGDCRMKW